MCLCVCVCVPQFIGSNHYLLTTPIRSGLALTFSEKFAIHVTHARSCVEPPHAYRQKYVMWRNEENVFAPHALGRLNQACDEC